MRVQALLLALSLPLLLAAAPPARVLDEDPPLPGEPLTGWEALGPPQSSTLTLDQAVEMALATHPDLVIQRAALQSAQGARIAAHAPPRPSLEVELLTLSEAGPRLDPGRAELSLDLSDLLLTPLAAAAAGPEVEAARLRLDEAVIRITYEVRAAWLEHQAALAAWRAALRSVDALAAGLDAQRAIETAGGSAARDLLAVEVLYEEARLRAAEIEVRVMDTREGLARWIGADPGTLPPLGPPPEVTVPTDLEERAVAASLGLRALDAEILAARRARSASRAEALTPEVELIVGAERDGAAWHSAGGVELSLPPLVWGRGEVMRADAELDRRLAEYLALERQIRSAARVLSLRLASASRRARHVEQVLVPARARLLDETLLHYNAMQVGLDPLLDAWRAHLAAELTLTDTWREVYEAQAALAALLAGALVEGPRAATSTPDFTSTAGGH